MHKEDAIDIGLVVATTAYSVWLDGHKHAEPDWTWLEVVVGVGAVLTAAGLRSRVLGGDWRDHERNVWRAFVLGGLPIISGEISQALRGWRDRDEYRKRGWELSNVSTSTLAGGSRATPPGCG